MNYRKFRCCDRENLNRLLFLIAIGSIIALAAGPAFAATGSEDQLPWFSMSLKLIGGLALFLYGMEKMAEALKSVAGNGLKSILARLTSSKIIGLLTGAFVTAVIQSSSVTTVMLVGFVSAGLMSLSQAIGVILGADIGTTITAQIVAFKVTKYALLLVAAGFALLFTSKSDNIKQYGNLIMGLGLIFFGMGVMSDGMYPLRTYQPFIELMQDVSNPVIGILVAALFTGLVQSSSAAMGVVIALALQGLISLEGGIALALGANIGTCITAGLAAIGKPREAVRVALAHVTFKIVGVLLIVPFIPYFAEFVRYISPVESGLTGLEKLAAETPRQIANAHTLFNVGIAFTFLPLASLFARFCEWAVPDKPLETQEIFEAKYLEEGLIATPALALAGVRREIGRMGELVEKMVTEMMPAVVSGNKEMLSNIAETDDKIDKLHGQIITYLGCLNRRELSAEQMQELMDLMAAANHLEAVGNLVESDMVQLGNQRIDEGIKVSEHTRNVLVNIHSEVAKTVRTAVQSVRQNDPTAARAVVGMKVEINRLVGAAELHQAQRLVAEEPNRLPAYTIEVQILDKLKRIYYYSKRMAKTVREPEIRDLTQPASDMQTSAA